MKIINENKKIPGEEIILKNATVGWYVSTTRPDSPVFYYVMQGLDGLYFASFDKNCVTDKPIQLTKMNEHRDMPVVPLNMVGLDSFEYTEERKPNRDEDYIELHNHLLLTIKKDGKIVVFSLARCYPTDLKCAGMVLGISQLIYNGELL